MFDAETHTVTQTQLLVVNKVELLAGAKVVLGGAQQGGCNTG